jgi:hypothetical protein
MMKIGHRPPSDALTLVYLPVWVVIVLALSSLFSLAFHLGFIPTFISLGLLTTLIVAVGVSTRQLSASAPAGTRLTLAHMGLVCLLGGVAAAPPPEFPPLMLWTLAALAATAAGVLMVEDWITEKIDAASPFSRRLGQQAYGLLVLSVAVLLWRSGKVDIWVIAIGAVHYILLILSLVLPALRRGSAAAWRPHARFALGVALAAALAPIVPPILVTTLAAVALGLALAVAAADISAARS